MRICHASLSDPFNTSPVLFPESTNRRRNRSYNLGESSASYAPMGSWRYATKHTRMTVIWAAALFSLGGHALSLFFFNTKHTPAPHFVQPMMSVSLMKMPPVIEDREEKFDDVDRTELGGGVDVPRQPEIPTLVALNNIIVQKLDPRSLQPNLDLTGTKLVAIPSNMKIGGTGGKGFKDIFDLADLDQMPTPVFQPKLFVPSALRLPGVEISLTVEFIVNNKGKVVDARVVQSSDSRYDEIMVANVMKWQFKPGKKKDRAVAVLVDQPFVLTLTSDE